MAKPKEVQVTITLPSTLLRRAQGVLDSRDTTLDDFVRLKLKGVLRPETFYDLDDRYMFGKYKGEVVERVIRTDPAYVAWCLREVEGFALTPGALEVLQDMDIDL